MRKTLLSLSVLAGVAALAGGAHAARWEDRGPVASAPVERAQYYGGEWRGREEWRHRQHAEWRRHHEWQRWHHRRDW
ncbi:MAG: hypothetical protein NVSMB18_07190 [Acetobacteraceae bacterium]